MSPAAGHATIELVGVAAVVWDGLGEAVTLDDLVADLADVFGRSTDLIRPEVEALLADLTAAAAVQRS